MVQKDDNVKNLCTLLDLFATKGVRGIFYGNIARDGEGVSAVGFNAKVCNRPAGLLHYCRNALISSVMEASPLTQKTSNSQKSLIFKPKFCFF